MEGQLAVEKQDVKPSVGNSNVHCQRNLGREPSASEILRDKASSYCFIYVSRKRYNLKQAAIIITIIKTRRVSVPVTEAVSEMGWLMYGKQT